MKQKIIIALFLVLAIIVLLVGCGGKGENPTDNGGTSGSETTNDTVMLASYKSAAISKLDEIVNPVIAKIPNEDLKTAVQTYYDNEKQYVNGITDLETAKAAATKVVEDTKVFVKDTLKPLAIQKLNGAINPLIEKIPDDELKSSVQDFYNKEILDDTKNFISC